MSSSTLVLSEVFPPQHGGSGKWFWELYQRLPENDFLMVVGNSRGTDPRDSRYPQPILRLDLAMDYRGVAKFSSLRKYASQISKVRKIARQNSAKMIHAARPLSEGLIARSINRLSGVPYLCYVHGEDITVARTSRELSIVTNSVLKHATTVIANSTFTQQRLMSDWGLAKEKTILLHPGVDTNHFTPAIKNEKSISSWADKLVLLTVGRLHERKGHDTVIKAVAVLQRQFPNLHYAIAGTGEQETALRQLAQQLGVENRVEFLGAPDDESLLNYYRNCDVFIMANRTIGADVEGFGIVFLEAQACGKPVIAGASGGTADTLQDCETGYLVDCTCDPDLQEKLKELLLSKTQRDAMGSRGRKFVAENFDWAQLARSAERTFSALTQKTRSEKH